MFRTSGIERTCPSACAPVPMIARTPASARASALVATAVTAAVRITVIAAIFLSSGSIVPIYFLAGMVSPDKPRELENTDVEETEFWRQVRRSPTRTARDIRLRLKDIDRRLADVESYVTTENRSLVREIEQLR